MFEFQEKIVKNNVMRVSSVTACKNVIALMESVAQRQDNASVQWDIKVRMNQFSLQIIERFIYVAFVFVN